MRGLRHRGEQPWLAWDDWVRSPRHALALLVLLGSVMFYIVAAEVLGFLPTAAIILTVLFLVLRVRPVLALVSPRGGAAGAHRLLQAAEGAAAWGLLTGVAW